MVSMSSHPDEAKVLFKIARAQLKIWWQLDQVKSWECSIERIMHASLHLLSGRGG